jgi:hypothetical protein
MSQISRATIARKKSVNSLGDQSVMTHYEEVVHPNEETDLDETTRYSVLFG